MTLLHSRRVVVTGMGSVTPLGNNTETLWNNLINGKSGIGYLTLIPEAAMTCRIGGECIDFDPTQYMDKKEARRMDRFMQFAMIAAMSAYKDAKAEGNVDLERLGVVIGTGAGGITTIENSLISALDKGYGKTSPFFIPMMLCDSGAGRVSIALGAKGPNLAIVTACSTGADSIGDAMRMIQNDEADMMIAGGAEAPITPLSVAGFSAARALSQRDDEPSLASRPFDKGRDGFVMSEGAAILVLEELAHAKARGAKIYGELIGYGRSSDAHDIVAPPPDGNGAARAMKAALRDSGIQPQEIQYVNAHGTSTPLGDIAETKAVKSIFGEYAKNGLVVSSTKSMTGHLLGAAGSLEAMVSILAINNKRVPPTINLQEADDECDLDYVPNTSREVPGLTTAMTNSFGFGGHNASLIFREYSNN
ncbi:MAG: beta-ketoacyl-ACP synthase II [Cyanobacteria bacterium]|nr:beta-ketoacyl-ACP synthase II [Cyanobacteriota bacterium]